MLRFLCEELGRHGRYDEAAGLLATLTSCALGGYNKLAAARRKIDVRRCLNIVVDTFPPPSPHTLLFESSPLVAARRPLSLSL